MVLWHLYICANLIIANKLMCTNLSEAFNAWPWTNGPSFRPLQFNYLSYELFLEKKSCQTPKKKLPLVSYGRKWFWNFLSDSKKKEKKVQVLRRFFVRVIQSTTRSYHCCSRASDLRMYISHPLGYRDLLIDWFDLVENRLVETYRYQS